MKRFGKLFKLGCLTVAITAASQTLYASAEANNRKKNRGNGGQAVISVNFSEEDARAYAESINETLGFVIENLKDDLTNTNDPDKIKYIENLIKDVEDSEAWDLFTEVEDNTFNLELPYIEKEIEIDGETYTTDAQGYFSLDKGADLEVNGISLFSDENLDINVEEDTNKVVASMSFDEFAEGAANMSEKMMDAEGQVTQKFYARVAPGKDNSYIGNGVGRSKVFFDTNIVGCNKHDKNTTSITAKQFAVQNSDCSQSVKIGVCVLAGTLPYETYSYSVYCVDEAVSSEDTSKENVYCHGRKKSNGRVNCSWFKGIGHSESFHTHVY